MTRRTLSIMKLCAHFAGDVLATMVTSAALVALLCWEFGVAVWNTAVLGMSAEDLEDLR